MKNIFVLILLLTSTIGFSQQKYKIFVDTLTNKLYYNRHLPVYFWISTAPDNSGQDVLLQPKVKKYANPYYWDTEGINTFHVKSPKNLQGYKEAIFQIWADGAAPVISLKYLNTLFYNQKPILGHDSKIKINANDYFSGVDKIFYAIDNQNFKRYLRPLHDFNEGQHILYIYATDKVGNKSDTLAKKFTVELTPPSVTLKIINSISNNYLGKNSLISFKASDQHGVKNIFYKVDDNTKYNKYIQPFSISNLNDGKHLIYYYATDKLGNQSQVFMKELTVDKTPPEVGFKFLGTEFKKNGIYYISSNTRLQVTYKDNSPLGKILYSVGNKTFSTKDIIDLSKYKGYKQICISAVDAAGNNSLTKCIRLIIDNQPPKITAVVGKPKFFDRDTLFITSQTPVNLYATDEYSGVDFILYAINNRDFKKYTNQLTIPNQGFNILYYKAKDKVDNYSKTDSLAVFIDNTPPQINIILSVQPYNTKIIDSDTLLVYPNNIKIYLSAVDDKTGERHIYYTINGGEKKLYSRPINLYSSKEKIIELYTESHDALGNTSTKKFKFIISPK